MLSKTSDMRQLLIIIFILLIYRSADCQVFGNIIEKKIQCTVLIKIGKGTGSGVLVRDTTYISLITAKHVIFDEKKDFKKLISTQALIQFYAKDFRADSANYILLDLNKLISNKLMLVDSLNDICVIKLAKIVNKNTINYFQGVLRFGHGVKYYADYLDDKAIIKKSEIFLGEDVFIVGFPSSIGLQQTPQFDYDKPLLKRGAIAGISDNFNTFIIDCPVFHGNSGGPVFLERKSFEKYSLRLIGIVTQYIPVLNPTALKKDLTIQNSSYAVIVPIEYALKLLNNNNGVHN